MIEIRLVDTENKKQVKEFIDFYYDLYKGDPKFVPPFRNDQEVFLNRKKYPFYQHSEGDFFTAWQDGKMVGRIAVYNNRPYNEYHHSNTAALFFFESIDSQEVANALFDKAAEWAKERGLDHLMGPKGYSLFDGYGLLVEEGFDERQTMNMSAYNYPYYQKLWENYGFERINEFVSMKFNIKDYVLPEKVEKVAEIVEKRGKLRTIRIKNRKEADEVALKIAHMYFDTFQNNWEYYPMSDPEVKFFIDNVLMFVDYNLVRFIKNEEDEFVGMLVNFPDLSAAMQRHPGTYSWNPILLIDLLIEMRKTNRALLNGFGVLPKYHKSGGDALLFSSMKKVFDENPQFEYCEAVQMADSAKEVRRDMETLGLKISKRHRVYSKAI